MGIEPTDPSYNRMRDPSPRLASRQTRFLIYVFRVSRVMQQAGEWYKQNKQLKRRSTALLHALPTTVDIDLTDATDAGKLSTYY